MGLKIHCHICDKFIRDVDVNSVGGLTGKEMCRDCYDRVQGLFGDVEKAQKKFMADLEKLYKQAQMNFEKLDLVYANYIASGKDLYKNAESQLNALVRDAQHDK